MRLLILFVISLLFSNSSHSFGKQFDFNLYLVPKFTASPDTKIPFQLIKDLIIISATVDGKKGHFILDSGAKHTTLNAQYFKGFQNDESLLRDISGNGSDFSEKRVTIQIGVNNKHTINAIIADFGEIEKILSYPILGYLGYDILKNHEVVFDFQQREIGFLQLNKKGNKKHQEVIIGETYQTVKLKRNGHLPYLTLNLKNKKLKFGIDSGASINLIQKELPKQITSCFQKQGFQRIVGYNGKEMLLESGLLHRINLFDLHWLPMSCVAGNMQAVNNMLRVSLDGLLGVEFLKQYKIAINYKKNLLKIWYPERIAVKDIDSK